MSAPSLKDVALRAASFGWYVFPLGVKSKKPDAHLAPNGFKSASNDPAQIEAWWTTSPDANIGIDLGRSNLTVLDFDKGEPPVELNLPATMMVKTSRGTHAYYSGVSEQGNMILNDTHLGEIKSDGGYVLAPFSVHPDGPMYTLISASGAQIVNKPVDIITKLTSAKKPTAEQMQTVKLSKGVRYNSLISYLGKLWAAGTPRQAVIEAGLAWAEEHFDLPEGAFNTKLVQGEIEHYLDHGYEQGQPTPDLKMSQSQTPDVVQPLQLIVDPEDGWQYAITPEEWNAQAELEFPVYPLKEGAGPTWDDEIMYGLAGDIVRKAAVYCEAHPAGMYLDLLVSFGNLVGRGPYFTVNSTRHHANEFMVRVGDSSISRKGTGRDAVNAVLKLIDPDWYKERVMSGFGSAESIINELRDDSRQQVRNKKKDNIFESVLVPGVRDKRLMIREPELASIFQLAGKTESRADIVLRDGWDSAPLHNRVKGKTDGLSNSNACQFPHMSISADTTRHELIQKMPKGADQNGFGNRFLYCYVRRVKLCPSGGPNIDWSPELQKLHDALVFGRDLEYVPMQKSANAVWNRMYTQIEQENASMNPFAASMSARGPAHVRRLALILCLLDNHDCIETKHLHAAKSIWDYCQDSARYIFGDLTLDQQRILEWIGKNGPTTISGIREGMFKRNRKAEWIRAQVNGLIQAGKLVANGEQLSVKQ